MKSIGKKIILWSLLGITHWAILPNSSRAEPWVDTSNMVLRSSIQYLADSSLINIPTTTFPLMWHDIGDALADINVKTLNLHQLNAFKIVQRHHEYAQSEQQSIAVHVAAEDRRFTSYGDDFRDKNSISLSKTFIGDRFAANITTTRVQDPLDDESSRLDGSYLAASLGNWVISLGMQDRWWGPAWDSNLSLTNNARPIPALSLSRKSAKDFSIPFTALNIPWTITTFMGVMVDDRIIEDTLLWGFRLGFKPTRHLEINLTRLVQWAGKDRPHDLGTFWDAFKGNDNCGGNGPSIEACQAGQEPGNQMAGYDIRWSTQIRQQPIGLYFSMLAEDGDRRGGLSIFGEEQYQIGLDTQASFLNNHWRIYLEAADTFAICAKDENGDEDSINFGNCYYEHSTYQTGMRYNRRNINSLYDNDATSVVAGLISHSLGNTNFDFKLRWIQLNKDNSDKAPGNTLIGNTITEIAENTVVLSTKVHHTYRALDFTLGADISQSEFDNDIDDESDINAYISIKYNL